MLCERANTFRKIAHVEDDYCVETSGHSANNFVNAIDRHEVHSHISSELRDVRRSHFTAASVVSS
jgi:hypothetical protein